MGCGASKVEPIEPIKGKKIFGSYRQNDGIDGLMIKMFYDFDKEGVDFWLDKMRGEERSEAGMVAGVQACDCFCAVISPKYFQSKFCMLEMQTAIDHDRPIAVCFNGSKHTVQDAIGWIPEQFRHLLRDELIKLGEDDEFMTVGLEKLRAVMGKSKVTPITVSPIEGKKIFGSYRQNDGIDGLMIKMFFAFDKEGVDFWLDKMRGEERSEAGMLAFVQACDCFCAVISPKYFQSQFCVLEMQTAIACGKPIAVCFNGSKHTVQDALTWIPKEFAELKCNELIKLGEDDEFMTVGLQKLRGFVKKPSELTPELRERAAAESAAAEAAAAAEAEAREAALAKVGLASDLRRDYEKGERCSFWFIRAAKLRNFSGTTPPRMQELRRDHPDWLEQREISFTDGHAGHYVSNTLVISHRWEDPAEPDSSGEQFSAVKQHLLANEAIEWVWFDFWSMPQGRNKTEVENIEFTTMLPNINLLYLFCSVLILLDGSYMSRFWTQFEAFLSFRKVTASGLGPTPLTERRDAIICIHNADSEFDPPKLRKMWGDRTVDEAHAVLARPDVTVTNQKDKDVQLPKLQRLNDFAKSVLADV